MSDPNDTNTIQTSSSKPAADDTSCMQSFAKITRECRVAIDTSYLNHPLNFDLSCDKAILHLQKNGLASSSSPKTSLAMTIYRAVDKAPTVIEKPIWSTPFGLAEAGTAEIFQEKIKLAQEVYKNPNYKDELVSLDSINMYRGRLGLRTRAVQEELRVRQEAEKATEKATEELLKQLKSGPSF